jgi:AP-3 complex subunit beta
LHFYFLPTEEIAGMCIVSIKRLLQQEADSDSNTEMIAQLGKMLLKGKISVSLARASVMWLIGEHADAVPKIAPDVLRLGAKNFVGAVCVANPMLRGH